MIKVNRPIGRKALAKMALAIAYIKENVSLASTPSPRQREHIPTQLLALCHVLFGILLSEQLPD